MPTDNIFQYRSAVKANEIVTRAARTMRPAEIAVALGVAESTIRSWAVKPTTVIWVETASNLRALEARLASAKNGARR